MSGATFQCNELILVFSMLQILSSAHFPKAICYLDEDIRVLCLSLVLLHILRMWPISAFVLQFPSFF